MSKKTILAFFLLLNFFLISTVFGQTVGDYRSSVNGNWETPGSWQICTSVSPITWTTATNYPGQIAGNYAVLIQTGHVITIGTNGITTQTMGTLTISGSLVLTGTNTGGVGTNYFFDTQTIIVTPLLGTIEFIDKVNLKLPTNATLQVKFDLTPNPDYYGLIGDCNHNQDIVIGTSTYAYCNGGGSTGLTFYEVMSGGGTLNSAPTYSPNSPICYGETIMLYGGYIGPIGTGINYTWTITDPIGTSSTITAKDTSIINAIVGTYVVKLTCSTVYNSVAYSNSETILVTVNALPSTPTIGTPTQPTCTLPTGSVVLSGLPASGTWTLYQNGSTIHTATGGTGTYTVSGLAAGTYNFMVSNGTCTSGASSDVVINATTNTWNGTSWSNGTPISTQVITFNGSYSSTTDLTACSCTVNSGAVKINSGKNLILEGKLTVNAPGTLTFEDSASLVQTTAFTGENSGNIKYQRITAPIRQTDYTYWSSPVTPLAGGGYLLGSIATSQNYLSYDSNITKDWKYENASTQMTNGVGYAVQGPSTTMAGSPYQASFVGVPNNGNVSVPVIFTNPLDLLSTDPNYGVSYLLGNPYPSAINADTFLSTNSSLLDGTLYFWTHYTEIGLGTSNLGSGAFAFTSDDYASYNYTGGVSGIGYAAPTIGSSAIAKDIPNGKIAAGQGFFATSIATGNIIFNNSMRVAGTTNSESTGTNQQFFKTKSPAKTALTIEKNRVWLNLSNTQGAFKQTLIGYVTDATNDYDSRFDGESFDGNEFVDFYSVNQDKNLTIQGRALPFDENDEVPLGYRTTINGEFTINIDQVDGSLVNQAVFIEDKLTNTVFDLKGGNYTFNTLAGTFNDRFVLRYTNKTLGTNDLVTQSNQVLISVKNKEIKINSFSETIDKVTIYDVLGRQIYQNGNVNSNEILITNLVSSHQTLIVKTSLQNGKTVTDKIIY